MSFANVYFKRQAATQKPCYMCNRATSTVLATSSSVDFFYACDMHLSDPGFASSMQLNAEQAAAARKAGMTDQEYLAVLKTKAEYEERQAKREKAEKEKAEREKAKEKEKKEGKDEDKEKQEKDVKKEPSQSSSSPSPGPSASPPLSHQRYELHRDIFAMRQNIHKKRRQAAQAKEIAPRLPTAPRSMPARSPGTS